jgi:hypothetical protein
LVVKKIKEEIYNFKSKENVELIKKKIRSELDYAIKKDPDGSIEWILKNKLSPEVLGAEIKNAPARMAIELAKVPQKHRKMLNDILDQIKDLPPGFRDDTELVADLSDIGL